MLRQNFLDKYKGKRFQSADMNCSSNFFDEDKHFINLNKPFKEHEFDEIPNERLDSLVEGVLTNKKINNLIFKTNADKEARVVKKDSQSLRRYKKKLEEHTDNMSPFEMVKRRAKNEEIEKILKTTKEYHNQKKEMSMVINEKLNVFHKTMKDERIKDMEEQKQNTEHYRKKKFYETYRTIKNKILEGKVLLPDLSLQMEDVFSRLYHNAVWVGNKNDNSLTNENQQEDNSKTPKLKVKNVIKDSCGKEFSFKITELELMKCLTRHSGGPLTRSENYEKILSKPTLQEFLSQLDVCGNNFLHSAVGDGCPELVYYFLVKKFDPNQKNNDGDTPLHIACRMNTKLVKKLYLNY